MPMSVTMTAVAVGGGVIVRMGFVRMGFVRMGFVRMRVSCGHL